MKIRKGFVSNSSSASFIVGIPSKDEKSVLKNIFLQLEHIYFGKYYLTESIKSNLNFCEKRMKKARDAYFSLNPQNISKEERESKGYDSLDWAESDISLWERRVLFEKQKLEELEKIGKQSEVELVLFGLGYYRLCFSPTYEKEEIIGYQISSWVSLFNDYGDIPKELRNITGVLAFTYPNLKCWVEEDQ